MAKKNIVKLVLAGLMIAVLAAIPLLGACAEEEEPGPGPGPTDGEVEVIEWKFIIGHGAPAATSFDTQRAICQDIETMSGGRLILTPYFSGELVTYAESYQAVVEGVGEFLCDCPAYHTGEKPVGYYFFGWPQVSTNPEEVWQLFENFGMMDLYSDVVAEDGLVYLEHNYERGQALFFKDPIVTVDDFAGIKIRATGGLGQVMEKVGAVVIPVTAGEMYTSLATGVIDAAGYAGVVPAVNTYALHELTDYWLWASPSHHGLHWMARQDAWDAIGEDLQEIVKKAVYRYSIFPIHFLQYYDEVECRQTLKDAGVEEIIFSEAEMAKFQRACWEAMAEIRTMDADCEAGYQIIKDMELFLGRWPAGLD
jgi:TRAP-type mannitol/chloroaromatic compound transport system substrate-binding protein